MRAFMKEKILRCQNVSNEVVKPFIKYNTKICNLEVKTFKGEERNSANVGFYHFMNFVRIILANVALFRGKTVKELFNARFRGRETRESFDEETLNPG